MKCNHCNIDLVVGINIYPSSYKIKDFICKPCNQSKANKNKTWKKTGKGVYAIFVDTECYYVGESIGLNGRISQHKTYIRNPLSSRSGFHPLYLDLHNKNYSIQILEETPDHKKREQYWIDKLKPKYNSSLASQKRFDNFTL